MRLRCANALSTAVLVLFAVGCWASKPVVDQDGIIRFANKQFKVCVDPAKGGRISSWVSIENGVDWVLQGDRGMLMDHVTQQVWPGELLARRYEYKIGEDASGKPFIRLWTTIDGAGDKSISGILLEKTLTWDDASSRVDVAYKLTNNSNEPKSPALWIQNIVSPNGVEDGKTSFRPTTIGALSASYPVNGNAPEIDFRFDPTAGWTAIMDPKQQTGVVYLMDYNWLKCLYCSAQAFTQEWWCDPVMLSPGKSWETQVVIWPVSGLKSITNASANAISDIDLTRDGRRVHVRQKIAAGPANKNGGKTSFEMQLMKYPGLEILDHRKWDADQTNNTLDYLVEGVSETESVVLKISAGDNDSSEIFSAGTAILGTENQYRHHRPKRIRERFKPDNLCIAKNPSPRVLQLRGLFSNSYKLSSMVENLKGELADGIYKGGMFGSTVAGFPTSYSEMTSYDVIVLNHIPLESLSDDNWNMLRDYCECGGVLLVIGGPMCSTGVDMQTFSDPNLLPISAADLWKVRKAKSDMPLDKANSSAGIWRYSAAISQMPKDSAILSGTSENPVIVYRRTGKGVAAVFTPLALSDGVCNDGFWNAAGFPEWMANRVKDLMGLCGKESGVND